MSCAPGNLPKARLEDIYHEKCVDPKAHEIACRALLGHLSASTLKQWLLSLRRLGHMVEPSTSWGGFSKETMVTAFLRMDQPYQAVLQPTCEQPRKPDLEVAVVLFDPSIGPKLREGWIKKARRRLKLEGKAGREEEKKQMSRKVIAALKTVLPTCMGSPVKELRALVSSMTGIPLDEGARRLFFDSQLIKLTRVPNVRRKRRCLFEIKVRRQVRPK